MAAENKSKKNTVKAKQPNQTDNKTKGGKAKGKTVDVNTQLSTSDGKKRKSSLHPNYREITVQMTNGTTFKTRSTYGQDILKLDVDKDTHPAWSIDGSKFVNTRASAISNFNRKFNLDFLKSE